MMILSSFRTFLLLGLLALAAITGASCRTLHEQQKPVDPKAQQRFYDQGLQHYSKEKYELAREAFRKVVEISPNNNLGVRAKENLVKINQILKTLEGMKSK